MREIINIEEQILKNRRKGSRKWQVNCVQGGITITSNREAPGALTVKADEFIPPSVGGIVGCGPCCLKGNESPLVLNTVEPSVPQVPLWHGFIGRICLFKRALVCPGELLQAGSTIYRLPRRQGPIFVAGAVYEIGRPQLPRPGKKNCCIQP